ncbi:MAG: serine/threonine protein kinase [Labilithrix sp.]|nr:serine/threonine protein kinase [Labilithrix sp.]
MPPRMDSRSLRDLRGESDYPPASANGGDPLIGALIADRYRVVRKLGEGAQASVYVAKHTLIKRLVALKVLSPALTADRDLVHRFLDEGQVAGTMGHPNIVESMDMGVVEDGRPFLVLEYLEGTTVDGELQRRGALDVGRASFIGVQIASALGAAHARGIVHRDLKPENVFLIDRDGHGDHVKVLDFGISKLESRKEGTRAGLVVGTPDYMAPEQVTDPASVDARADVFALGAMLYEMLSGRLPLDAAPHEDPLEVVVRRTPAPLGRICPHLPPQIIAAVERAMHKDRAKRTQTIAEVRAALEPFAVMSVPTAPGHAAISGSTAALSGRPSRGFEASPPSASLAALSITSENAIVDPLLSSDRSVPVAASSATSLAAGGIDDTSRHAVLAATGADRLTAQLAAIAAASPAAGSGRGMAVPLLAGAFGAAAAGVIVFLALRSNAPNVAQAVAVNKLEATAGARSEASGAPVAVTAAAVGAAQQPGSMAAVAAAPEPKAPTGLPAKTARDAAAKAHDAQALAGVGSADARRDREKDKGDFLAAAAAEASAHSAPSAFAATAAPSAPEAATAATMAPSPAAARPTILPFGEGMSRPSSISPDEIQFTREAREARVSGTMIVRCLITTEGGLQNCRVIKSVPMMDAPVLSALSRHQGSPVMYQGKPVSVEYTYTIRLKSPD